VRLLLTDAQNEFSGIDVVASPPDDSSKSLHSVIDHCDDLINAKAVGLADVVSSAKALKGRSIASLKALNARVQLDDVVDSIERNRTRQLTPGEARALRERLLSDIHIAVADSGKALDLDSQCASAWVERIRAYRLAANPNAANEATAKALVLFPDDKHIRALANQ
jgi:hypothetical protein